MPTYIYQTLGSEPRQFEVIQRMTDEPLQTDPDTGEAVRRVVTGGIGIRLKGLKRSTVVNKKSAAATACGCATGRPHRHVSSGPKRCGHSH